MPNFFFLIISCLKWTGLIWALNECELCATDLQWESINNCPHSLLNFFPEFFLNYKGKRSNYKYDRKEAFLKGLLQERNMSYIKRLMWLLPQLKHKLKYVYVDITFLLLRHSVVTLRAATKNTCAKSCSFSIPFYTRKAFYSKDTTIFIKVLPPNCK